MAIHYADVPLNSSRGSVLALDGSKDLGRQRGDAARYGRKAMGGLRCRLPRVADARGLID